MRRIALAFALFFLFSLNLHAQTAQNPPPAPPPSDPKAAAVVQAAITRLGGATTIAQAQYWTFQGSLSGPIGSSSWNEVVTRYNGIPSTATGTNTKMLRVRASTSLLLPALVGAVLAQESKDPYWVMHYGGPTTLGSKAVTQVVFSRARTAMADAQTWFFDTATGLPAQIVFRLPAQIGLMRSPLGVVALSNYQAVSGVLHPFQMVMSIQGTQQPEVVTIQSLSASATDPTAPASSGGAQ